MTIFKDLNMKRKYGFLNMILTFLKYWFLGICGVLFLAFLTYQANQFHLISDGTSDTFFQWLGIAGVVVFFMPVIVPVSFIVGKFFVPALMGNQSYETSLDIMRRNDSGKVYNIW